jgi:hypothetical protein
MSLRNKHGAAVLVVVVGLLLGGLGLFIAKPRFMHGDSRRARQSQEASAALQEAATKQSAEAAASVVKIGEAAATAPESPERTFITRDVPVALAKLPSPDPSALIEAERRKVAVMEGRLEEAARLYDKALKRAETLEREKAAAMAERQRVDQELQSVAAERLGAERQRNAMVAVAVLLILLYGWAKYTHFSPAQIAQAAVDIRGGAKAITALDGVATMYQQKLVKRIARLKAPDPEE